MASPAAGSLEPAPPDSRDFDAYRLLGVHAHSWVLVNISMAHNKAGFVAFGAAALAAYLRADAGALVLLVASAVCALLVVALRTGGRGCSLTYRGGIAAHGSAERCVRAVEERSADELSRLLLEQSCVVSELALRKYRWLRVAVWLAAAGFLLVLIAPFLP